MTSDRAFDPETLSRMFETVRPGIAKVPDGSEDVVVEGLRSAAARVVG